jgi:hypothetical protein
MGARPEAASRPSVPLPSATIKPCMRRPDRSVRRRWPPGVAGQRRRRGLCPSPVRAEPLFRKFPDPVLEQRIDPSGHLQGPIVLREGRVVAPHRLVRGHAETRAGQPLDADRNQVAVKAQRETRRHHRRQLVDASPVSTRWSTKRPIDRPALSSRIIVRIASSRATSPQPKARRWRCSIRSTQGFSCGV